MPITLIRLTPLTSVIYLFNAALVGTVAFLPFRSHRTTTIVSTKIIEEVIEQLKPTPTTQAQSSLNSTFWFLEPNFNFILKIEQVILALLWSLALIVGIFPIIWLVYKGLKWFHRIYLRCISWKLLSIEIVQSLILNLDTLEILAKENAPYLVPYFDIFYIAILGLFQFLMLKYIATLILKVCFKKLNDFRTVATFDLKISYNYDTPLSEPSLTHKASEENLQEIERQLALNLSFPSFDQKRNYCAAIFSDIEEDFGEDIDQDNRSDSGYSSVDILELTEEEMKYHPDYQSRDAKVIVVEKNVVDNIPGAWLPSYTSNTRELYVGKSDGMKDIRRSMRKDRKQGHPKSLLYVYGLTLD